MNFIEKLKKIASDKSYTIYPNRRKEILSSIESFNNELENNSIYKKDLSSFQQNVTYLFELILDNLKKKYPDEFPKSVPINFYRKWKLKDSSDIKNYWKKNTKVPELIELANLFNEYENFIKLVSPKVLSGRKPIKRLKEFIIETNDEKENILSSSNIKELQWNGNPKIGWWEENSSLILYHGTHWSNIEYISKNGITAPNSGPTANWVSLALEPNTAFGYASMGGESGFRAAGAKAKTILPEDRIVLVLKLPMPYVKKFMETEFRGNVKETKTKLTNKTEYDSWKRSDQEYYALTELRFPKNVPSKYIVGFMRKKKK